MERTDQQHTPPTPTEAERVAALHAKARADYGTPAERAQRVVEARGQLGDARSNGNAAASVFRGRRS
jgi:hypothetical protein